jgi:osmotically-inducible protein OsmY
VKRVVVQVTGSPIRVGLLALASSETIKSTAGRIARDTRGVKDVHNELLVGRMEY